MKILPQITVPGPGVLTFAWGSARGILQFTIDLRLHLFEDWPVNAVIPRRISLFFHVAG